MLSVDSPPARSREELQNLIIEKTRHLHKLQEQQAVLGIHTPPYILIQIEDLQAELEELRTELQTVKARTNAWQALVVDTDAYWREIIDRHIARLGGSSLEHPVFPSRADQDIIEACDLVIISPRPASGLTLQQWIKQVIKLGRQLPVILLASREDRDAAVALRQACRKEEPPIRVTTIFKDNFDGEWFARVIRQKLARRKVAALE